MKIKLEIFQIEKFIARLIIMKRGQKNKFLEFRY